jgi:hypothetical protein
VNSNDNDVSSFLKKEIMKTKYAIEHFVETIDDDSTIPQNIAHGIRRTVEDFAARLENFDDAKASQKTHPDTWSRKEILGHLIDSASNNHQRFVRVRYLKDTNFLSYEQKEWVSIQRYNSCSWKELMDFWKSYNLHLARVIENMPIDCLQVSGTLGTYGQVTIGYIIVDYLGHMQHHLRQIDQME